jgi:hypothetical protein
MKGVRYVKNLCTTRTVCFVDTFLYYNETQLNELLFYFTWIEVKVTPGSLHQRQLSYRVAWLRNLQFCSISPGEFPDNILKYAKAFS